MTTIDQSGSQLNGASRRALGAQKGARALKARAAILDAKIAELVAQNAGLDEITATLGCHQSRVYAWASREKTRIPMKHECRPFKRGVVTASPSQSGSPAIKAPSITPNAMKAQAAMFRLLDAHFDPDSGRYDNGWDDARVAKESGIACGMVAEFRRQGFGELKSSPELQAIARDLASVKSMVSELEARLAKAGYR